MDLNETQQQMDIMSSDIQQLQQAVASLKDVQTPTSTKLDRHLDNSSKNIINQTVADKIFDIVWNNYFYYATTFDSVDRYFTPATGSVQATGQNGLELQTTTSTNNITQMVLFIADGLLSIAKDTRFRVTNKVDSITNIDWYMLTLANGTDNAYVGVEMKNGIIYGLTSDGTTINKVSLQSYVANTFYAMEGRFYPGNKCDFYVNGNLLGTSTINLPKTAPTILFDDNIQTLTNAARTSYTSHFEFIQKK